MPGCSSSASTATLVAVDHVEDAVGQPGLLEQLCRQERRRGVLLGRLQDEAVPAGDRRRPHPHGHHGGEVEGRDAGHDTERLPDRVDVDSRRRLLGELALDQGRDPARILDHLEPACDLAERVGEHLAVLGREELREVLPVGVEELADPEEELGALRERHGAPRLPGLGAVPHRRVDLLDRGEVDSTRLEAERGVVDRAAATRRPVDPLPADPVRDPRDRLAALGGRRLGKLRHA